MSKIFSETSQFYIYYLAQPDIRYPAKLLAGYPSKSVSGTTLVLLWRSNLKGLKGHDVPDHLLDDVGELPLHALLQPFVFLLLTRRDVKKNALYHYENNNRPLALFDNIITMFSN